MSPKPIKLEIVIFLLIVIVGLNCSAYAGDQELAKETKTSGKEEIDLSEISRQLDNPLTGLWSLTFENKTYIKKGDRIDGEEIGNVLNFQPGMPVPLGADQEWVFIARPVFPLVTNPVLDTSQPDGIDGHETGLGDIQLLSMVGPNRKDGMVWGLGATFKFPTATDDALGQDKYQAGPAAMLFSISKPWVTGVLVQNWWSFAGDDDAPDTGKTDIQYVIRYSLPHAWSVGMGPTISIDWKADSDDRYTVPVGLGVTKTLHLGRFPVKFRLEAHYALVRPDSYGDAWTFIFRMAPVIPSPF